jgi:esterase/lipase superfamily enzyme
MRFLAQISASERKKLVVRELMIAAPDLDVDHGQSVASSIFGSFGMTMYASAADRVLQAAKRLAENIPREGDVPFPVVYSCERGRHHRCDRDWSRDLRTWA